MHALLPSRMRRACQAPVGWFGRFALAPVWVVGLMVLVFASGCQTNQATGERQFIYLDDAQEAQIGEQAAAQIRQQQPILDNPRVQARVNAVGQELAALSERPGLDWEFVVIDQPTVNAFALPGGKIYIYRGLLEQMTNEAQLAAVLGHEIAHVTGRHHNDRMVAQMGVSALATGAAIAGEYTDNDWATLAGVGVGVGGNLTVLSFGRDDEHQSDELGVRYMTRAGYDPRGMVQLMQLLGRGGGDGIEWLQTHPLPASRVERVQRMIRENYPNATPANGYGLYEQRYRQQVLGPLGVGG